LSGISKSGYQILTVLFQLTLKGIEFVPFKTLPVKSVPDNRSVSRLHRRLTNAVGVQVLACCDGILCASVRLERCHIRHLRLHGSKVQRHRVIHATGLWIEGTGERSCRQCLRLGDWDGLVIHSFELSGQRNLAGGNVGGGDGNVDSRARCDGDLSYVVISW
jgi:hypothetical protein